MRDGPTDSEPAGAGVATDRGWTAAPRIGAAGWPPDFAIAVERRGSGTAVLVLAGEFDLYCAPDVEKALAETDGSSADGGETSPEAARRVVVDLRSVTFIDSTTLAILLAASRRQQAQGAEFLVLVGPQTPMTAFEVTGFDRLLAIRRLDDDPAESAL